ncbi:GIY-YIG nuclease family protein [Streptomyces sp. NPDC014006]
MANRTSTQNLRKRVRYHYRGNAAGSTLRLTLGAVAEPTSPTTARRA